MRNTRKGRTFPLRILSCPIKLIDLTSIHHLSKMAKWYHRFRMYLHNQSWIETSRKVIYPPVVQLHKDHNNDYFNKMHVKNGLIRSEESVVQIDDLIWCFWTESIALDCSSGNRVICDVYLKRRLLMCVFFLHLFIYRQIRCQTKIFLNLSCMVIPNSHLLAITHWCRTSWESLASFETKRCDNAFPLFTPVSNLIEYLYHEVRMVYVRAGMDGQNFLSYLVRGNLLFAGYMHEGNPHIISNYK